MRAALALAGGAPLWLPDGRAAEVAVDADDGGDGRDGAEAARASFVLHCPHAGAIEVHLSMDRGGIRAGVVTPGGATAERADGGDGRPGHPRWPRRPAARRAPTCAPGRRPSRRRAHPRGGSMSARKPSGKRAAALRYDGPDAPRVVASGRNLVADKILEAARGRRARA